MGLFDEIVKGSNYTFPETKASRYDSPEQFRNRCNDYIKSMKVAIDRKSKGSPAEEGYFLEKIDNLRRYFLETEIR